MYLHTYCMICHMVQYDVTLCKPVLGIIVFYASPGVFPDCICPSPLNFPCHLASMADLVEITRQQESAMQIVHDIDKSNGRLPLPTNTCGSGSGSHNCTFM